MKTATRTEFTQRAAAFGLAATLTLAVLGSIDTLAVRPAPDSLLAQRGAPAQLAAAPASASPRS